LLFTISTADTSIGRCKPAAAAAADEEDKDAVADAAVADASAIQTSGSST